MKILVIVGLLCLGGLQASPAVGTADQNSVAEKTEELPVPADQEVVVAEAEAAPQEEDVPQDRQILLDPCEQGQGVCLSQFQCSGQGGERIGFCNGGNHCCHIAKTCEKGKEVEITFNNTYFVEPKVFDDPDGPLHCNMKVKKIASTIFQQPVCQMRLDFVAFNIIGPDPKTGDCKYDFLTIEQSDANTKVQNLCGLNDGQHIYVDVMHTDFIKLRMNVDYSREPHRLRKWNIRVTQIPCNSPRLAPPGCLQYYEDYSGVIKSFNYGATGVNETSYPLSQRYAMCFKRGPDACRISLKKADAFGLGAIPIEADTRMDTFPDIDTECYDKKTMVRATPSKAYLVIDNIKMCGKTFHDEYRTEDNGLNVISFVSPDFEEVRVKDPPLQPPGFKFYYRLLSCSNPK